MTDQDAMGGQIPLDHAPPELAYPGLSPQRVARVRQLWSASGLDFERCWRLTVRRLPGFRAVPRVDVGGSSAQVDLVFLFDQCVIWVGALHAAAAAGSRHEVAGLTAAQWHGLAGVTARLSEQLAALRLLALSELPMPAMQIARSISEDVDMALVLLVRRKLAQLFADCRTAEDAGAFWRRHIAGGRAFRTLSEKLYEVGIDHSADTEYSRWRQTVLTTLGAAVHSNALLGGRPERRPGDILVNDDSLHFATYRIHELCAYAQLVRPQLTEILAAAGAAEARLAGGMTLAGFAGPLNAVLVNQIQSLTPVGAQAAPPAPRH